MIIPPFRFGIVEEGVYRSAQIRSRNLPFLQELNIKTILSLTPHSLSSTDETLASMLPTLSLTCYHVPVPIPKENVPLQSSLVMSLIRFLLDPSHYPILVHCLDGKLVVGIVMMCLRKVQGWALPCIFNEQARYCRGDDLSQDELKFVGKFGGELDFSVPLSLPFAFDVKPIHPSSGGISDVPMSTPSLNQPLPYIEEDWPLPSPINASRFISSSSSSSSSTHILSNSAPCFMTALSMAPTTSSSPSMYPSDDASAPMQVVPPWFWEGTVPLKKHVYPSIRIKPPRGLLQKAQAQAQREEQQQKEEKKSVLKTMLLTEILSPSVTHPPLPLPLLPPPPPPPPPASSSLPAAMRVQEDTVSTHTRLMESEEMDEEGNVSRMVQALNLEGFSR